MAGSHMANPEGIDGEQTRRADSRGKTGTAFSGPPLPAPSSPSPRRGRDGLAREGASRSDGGELDQVLRRGEFFQSPRMQPLRGVARDWRAPFPLAMRGA